MAHILTGMQVEKENQKYVLIRHDKVADLAPYEMRIKSISVNCHGFYLRPGKVMVDRTFGDFLDFSSYKKRLLQHISFGMTTLVVFARAEYERQVLQSIRKMRHHMINSTVDYAIALSFPLKRLTPSLMRLLRREKVPLILCRIHSEKDLDDVAWPWLREALFPYKLVFVPEGIPSSREREKRHFLDKWRKIMHNERLAFLDELEEDGKPLGKEVLRTIGIFPHKGELRRGGDADYNLFRSSSLVQNGVDHYDILEKEKPDIVTLKGRILKAGNCYRFRPGSGKEIRIAVPGYFATYRE